MDLQDSPFEWAEQLGCPKKYLTNTAQRVLSMGTSSMIWEHIGARIESTKKINEKKKNIILHALKTGSSLPALDSIKGLRELKAKRENIQKQIEASEIDVTKKEFINRQLAQQYSIKRQTSHKLKVKNMILKAKCLEKQSDIDDLIECKRRFADLQPPEGTEIDPTAFDDCLSLVTTLVHGNNKKEVFQQVNSIVETVAISTIWDQLHKKRSEANDELFQLINDVDRNFIPKTLTPMNEGFAKIWQTQIHLECSIQKTKISNAQLEEQVFEKIRDIESAYQGDCPEFQDWLPLMIEVNKKETIQTNLQNEIESLKKLTSDLLENESNESYSELTEFDDTLKTELNEKAQEVHKSLKILKNSESFITETRNNLVSSLENLQNVVLNENWSDIDVRDELVLYHENFDLDALRKISLKGTVNEYRHLSRCINAASREICVPPNHPKKHHFPMIKSPIYHLLDCFKSFMLHQKLYKEMDTLNELSKQLDTIVAENPEHFDQNTPKCAQLMDILMETDVTCDKIDQSVKENYESLDHWVNQTVEKVALAITSNHKVHGFTLKEWKQRYTAIIYEIVNNL